MADVSVIVPARDAAATIGATLAALGAQELPAGRRAEVIVVDNGSSDETAAIARGTRGVGQVIVRARGEGPAAARNAGAAAATAPLLAFTDADCEPQPDWLAAGLRAAESADIVQGRVIPDPDATLGPFDRTVWVTQPGLFETANLFVAREWWERVGGFAELIEDAGAKVPFGEDAWFGWRAQRAGARTTFAQDAVVHHAVFPRGAAGYLRDRGLLAQFPPLAQAIPELRRDVFFARWFLTRRSAAFDLALAATLVAASGGKRRWAIAAIAPYAALVARDAQRWGGGELGARAAAVGIAADALGAVALARGSITAREPLL